MKCWLLFLCLPLAALTVDSISSPISGYSGFSFTVSSVPTGTCSIQYSVNGEAQWPIIYASGSDGKWMLPWNTFQVFNSGSSWHHVTATAGPCDPAGSPTTSAAVAFSVQNTVTFAGGGSQGPAYLLMNAVSTANGSGGSGCTTLVTWGGTCTVTFTFNGTNASNLKKYDLWVDGTNICTGTSTSTSINCSVDTTKFSNKLTTLTLVSRDTAGPGSTFEGAAYPIGQWEQQVTFSNGATPMALLLGPQEAVTAPSATIQLSCTLVNTDLTTGSCTSPSYSSDTTSVMTVNSSSGLATGVAFGFTQITVTANGLTRTRVQYVASTNVLPHLCNDGTLCSSYTAGKSFWFADGFANDPVSMFNDPMSTFAQVARPMQLAGWNVLEDGNVTSSGTCSGTQSAFTSGIDTLSTNAYNNILLPYNLRFHFFTTALFNTTNPESLYDCGVKNTSTGGQGYSPHGWTIIAQHWHDNTQGRVVGIDTADEYQSHFPYPLTSMAIGAGAFNTITCNSSTTYTVNSTGTTPLATWGGGTGATMIITGATTHSSLNTTLGGALYTIANYNGLVSYQFTGPMCGASTTIDATSDPGLVIQPFVTQWYNTTEYLPQTLFTTLVTDMRAGANPLIVTTPNSEQSNQYARYQWMGSNTLSDYADIYPAPSSLGTPQHVFLTDFLLNYASGLTISWHARNVGNSQLQAPRAWIALGEGITSNYTIGINSGVTDTLTAVGKLITFANPHPELLNVTPNSSRLTITSSANSYFNTDFYIDRCPTTTTCYISRKTQTGSATAGTGGTVTFENGGTLAQSPGPRSPTNGGLQWAYDFGTGDQAVCNHQGQYLTMSGVTGTDASYYNNTTFIYIQYMQPSSTVSGAPYVFAQRSGCPTGGIREVPSDSETSMGSADVRVIPNDSYVRGRDAQGVSGETTLGPRVSFANAMLIAIYGGSGVRYYAPSGNHSAGASMGAQAQCWPLPTANCGSGPDSGAVQAGINPRWDNGDNGLLQAFYGTGAANLWLNSMAARGYLYQPRYGAPDVGANIEASLRKGSKGNLLITVNVQDAPQTRAIDISGCAVSGQATIVYTFDWRGPGAIRTIAANTTTDTATWSEGGVVAYLCSNNASAEYAAPVKSIKLPTGATKTILHYGYDPVSIFNRTDNAVDCTTACAVPIDPQVSQVYVYSQPLASDGSTLVTNPVVTKL